MLIAANKQSLTLEILGYQFPEINEGDDADWLMIRIAVETAKGAWRSMDPCLLSTEALMLADWLEALDCDAVDSTALEFIEPNLKFQVAMGQHCSKVLRVCFRQESRPKWAVQGHGCWVDFPLQEIDPKAAAAELRRQAGQYPPRGVGRPR